MDVGAISRAENLHERAWRQNADLLFRRACAAFRVPGIGPGQHRVPPNEPCSPIDCRVRSVGQSSDVAPVGALLTSHEPIGVESKVDCVGANRTSVKPFPHGAESLVIRIAALFAWPMPCAQRRRLVEKEQFRVTMWLHDRSMPLAELRDARDPSSYLPWAHDLSPIVVKDAAIAHHEAASRHRHDLTERRDPVLQQHHQRRAKARISATSPCRA
jgi:hypothetical protein